MLNFTQKLLASGEHVGTSVGLYEFCLVLSTYKLLFSPENTLKGIESLSVVLFIILDANID